MVKPPALDEPGARFYVFGSTGRFRRPLPPSVKAFRATEMDQAVRVATGKNVFISMRRSSTAALLKAGLGGRRSKAVQLLALKPPPATSLPALLGVFGEVFGVSESSRWLPVEELLKAITVVDSANRFIGGAADFETETVALVRGDRGTMVLPFSAFETSGDGVEADFSRLGFADYGHTVVLGDYEASADAILYENDDAYRRMLNKERSKIEKTFGASLRRLRLQRKLTQDDFPPLSKKTISRIEKNEINKPRGKTLETIARRLGVAADEVGSY